MKNLIVRTITGVLFVAAIVTCFLRPEAMILLFALVTGLTLSLIHISEPTRPY